MKKEDLFDAIGEIEDEYVEEAHKDYVVKKQNNRVWRQCIPIVAGLAALFLVTILFAEFAKNMPGLGEKSEVPAGEGSVNEESAEDLVVDGEAEGGYDGECETAPETESYDNMAGAPDGDSYGAADGAVDGAADGATDGDGYTDDTIIHLPETIRDCFGGMYKGENGELHIVITEDTKENRALICKEYELNKDDVIFDKGKYTLHYLLDLQSKISNRMGDGKFPNVISSALMENMNCILVQVKKETQKEMKILEELDTIGGAISIEVKENEVIDDALKDEAYEEEPRVHDIE